MKFGMLAYVNPTKINMRKNRTYPYQTWGGGILPLNLQKINF